MKVKVDRVRRASGIAGGVIAALCACVAASLSFAVGSGGAAQQQSAAPDFARAIDNPGRASEAIELRERQASTYRLKDGKLVTRVSQEPVHYRRDGRWAKIDKRLVDSSRAGYLARNAADEYVAELPASLADPVRFAAGGAWVTFAIDGYDEVAGSASGSAASYRLDDAAVLTYTTDAGVLRERIELTSADASPSYRYDVRASDGLSAALASDGSVRFSRDGRQVFRFAPPVAWDAAGKTGDAEFRLDRTDDGYRLTLRLDPGWLSAAGRRFPVTIDPDVSWVGDATRHHGTDQDCTISQAASTQNLCALPYLEVGGPAGAEREALLKFDVRQAIAPDAQVLDAWFGLYNEQRTGGTDANDLRLRGLTQPWTNDATAATADGTQAWSPTARDASPAGPAVTVGQPGYWYGWQPVELVKDWITGARPNYGMVLEDAGGDGGPIARFTSTEGGPNLWPYIDVVWQPALGRLAGYATPELARDDDTRSSSTPPTATCCSKPPTPAM